MSPLLIRTVGSSFSPRLPPPLLFLPLSFLFTPLIFLLDLTIHHQIIVEGHFLLLTVLGSRYRNPASLLPSASPENAKSDPIDELNYSLTPAGEALMTKLRTVLKRSFSLLAEAYLRSSSFFLPSFHLCFLFLLLSLFSLLFFFSSSSSPLSFESMKIKLWHDFYDCHNYTKNGAEAPVIPPFSSFPHLWPLPCSSVSPFFSIMIFFPPSLSGLISTIELQNVSPTLMFQLQLSSPNSILEQEA